MQVTKRTKGNWLELRAARKIERTQLFQELMLTINFNHINVSKSGH